MGRKRILGVIMVSCLGASCAHLPEVSRIRPPLVSLQNVQYKAVGLVGFTMETELQIENPNSFAVTIPYINYDLYLNDIKCGRGSSGKKLKVRAYSTRKVDVPIQLTFIDMVGSIARALRGKSGSYRIDGEIVIQTVGGDHPFPFEKEGTADFKRSPGVERQAVLPVER